MEFQLELCQIVEKKCIVAWIFSVKGAQREVITNKSNNFEQETQYFGSNAARKEKRGTTVFGPFAAIILSTYFISTENHFLLHSC